MVGQPRWASLGQNARANFGPNPALYTDIMKEIAVAIILRYL